MTARTRVNIVDEQYFLFHTDHVFDGSVFRDDIRRILIRGNRIIACGGSALDEIFSASDAQVIDVRGMTVSPGFVDAHCHFLQMGLYSLAIDCTAARSASDFFSLMERAAADNASPGTPLVAVNWDESEWPEQRPPERSRLDAITRDRPIVAWRVCGHMAVLNSAALALIPERHFRGDRQRGVVVESALKYVGAFLEGNEERYRSALQHVQNMAFRQGVCAVHDIMSGRAFSFYQRALNRRELHIDVTAYLPARDVAHHIAAGLRGGFGNEKLRFGGIKVFTDGSLGARTAALYNPYHDSPRSRGLLLISPKRLQNLMVRATMAGIPVMVHAIGDRAIGMVLDALETVPHDHLDGYRHRIEHLEVLSPQLVDRLARTPVIASVQPNFVRRWSVPPDGMNHQRLGPERMIWSNPYATLLERGLTMVMGSDCMPFGPLYGMAGAVLHAHGPSALSLEATLRCCTSAPAEIIGQGAVTGKIAPGFRADLVFLSPQLRNASDTLDSVVQATMIDGHFVYRDGLDARLTIDNHPVRAIKS